jgi:hypothetical protein
MEAVILEMAEQMRMVWFARGASEFPSDKEEKKKNHIGKQRAVEEKRGLRDQIFSCS